MATLLMVFLMDKEDLLVSTTGITKGTSIISKPKEQASSSRLSMASNIKANGQEICPTDLENKFGSINIPKPHTKGHFSMEISKAMPNIRILTFSIRGDFRIIKFLGPEKLSIKMDKHLRVNS